MDIRNQQYLDFGVTGYLKDRCLALASSPGGADGRRAHVETPSLFRRHDASCRHYEKVCRQMEAVDEPPTKFARPACCAASGDCSSMSGRPAAVMKPRLGHKLVFRVA